MHETLEQKTIDLYHSLQGARREIDNMVDLYNAYTLKSNPNRKKTTKNIEVVDTSVIIYEIYSAIGFRSYVWNDNRPPTYSHNNKDIKDKPEIKAYYEQVSALMAQHVFNNPKSGFQRTLSSVIRDYRNLGTGFLVVTENRDEPVYTFPVDFFDCYFNTDELGRINEFYYTTRLKKEDDDKKNEVVEVLTKFWLENGLWCSFSIDRNESLLIQGSELTYSDQPIFVARRNLRSGENYGLGNGLQALPAIRSLNEMQHMLNVALKNNVIPPLAQTSGLTTNNSVLDLSTGAISVINNNGAFFGSGQNPIIPLLDKTNLSEISGVNDIKKRIIMDHYQFDQFLELNRSNNMTASEATIRNDIRTTLFAGDCLLLYEDTLNPTLRAIMRKAFNNGLLGYTQKTLDSFPEVDFNGKLSIPPELQNVEDFLDIEITYHAPATKGDYQTKLQNLSQTFQFLASVEAQVAQYPALAESVDLKAMRESFAKYSNIEELLKESTAQQTALNNMFGGTTL